VRVHFTSGATGLAMCRIAVEQVVLQVPGTYRGHLETRDGFDGQPF
jgi:hypothetical protein